MDDQGDISDRKKFIVRSDLRTSTDDRKVDALKCLLSEPKDIDVHPLNENDIAVMRGIAESGALKIQREVGGLYDPKRSFKPCTNLPDNPRGYAESTGLYKCGLSDIILGEETEVVIMWPRHLMAEAAYRKVMVWHTHPDQANPGIIHSPPSVLDFQVAMNVCYDLSSDVDQLVVTNMGLWRLHVRLADLMDTSQEDVQNSILAFNYYAAFIQSDEEVSKTNRFVDTPHDKMSVDEFLAGIARNIKWFTVEFHPFEKHS